MQNLIVSCCGTSLLINNSQKNIRTEIINHANDKEKNNIPNDVIEWIEKRKNELLNIPFEEATKLSAELNGIYRFYKGNYKEYLQDTHILISTDTYLGKQTSNIIGKFLSKNGFRNVYIWDDIKDLRTSNLEEFHLGIIDLIKRLDKEIPPYKKSKYSIIFNLTGGFKSIQGILQTLSQFYADEAIYIFEKSEELLRIPKLPITFNIEDTIKKNITTWRRLSLNLNVSLQECKDIPNIFLFSLNNEVTLSAWGELVWQQCKSKIYREKFWTPPSNKIEYTPNFEKSLSKLDKDKLYDINNRMDELACHLELPDHPNPRSLNCKKIKNISSKEEYTHEIYAWSDKDAARIYGICKQHTSFKIIKIDRHLK